MIDTLTYQLPLPTFFTPQVETPSAASIRNQPIPNVEATEPFFLFSTGANERLHALAEPQACSPEALQQVYPKLQSLERSVRSTAPTLAAQAPEALFDVYALLRLLADVAQEQRDSARSIRKAYSAQAKIAIQQQADLQRSAAYTGLAMGLTACAISVTMQVGNLSLSTAAKVKQDEVGKQLGLPEAQKAYAQEVKLETSNRQMATKEQTATDKTLRKVLGDEAAATFKTALGATPEVADARAQWQEAQQQLGAARDRLAVNPNSAEAKAEVEVAIQQGGVAAGNYRTALRAQTQQYEALADASPNDAAAAARAASARSYQQVEEVELPAFFGGNGAVDNTATQRFNLIQGATQADPVHRRWSAIASISQATAQITASIGQTLNLSAQQISQLQGARAIETGAVASKARAAADAAAAIFSQEADILKAVLDMMKGILQSENQSMETILRA